MGKQISDSEAIRDEILLSFLGLLIGVFLLVFGGLGFLASSGKGLLWVALGVAVICVSVYVIRDRVKRFAEAREEAFLVVLLSILFPYWWR